MRFDIYLIFAGYEEAGIFSRARLFLHLYLALPESDFREYFLLHLLRRAFHI